VQKISNNSVLYLIFTNEMKFPSDMKEILNLPYVNSNTTEFDFMDRRELGEEQERKNQTLLGV